MNPRQYTPGLWLINQSGCTKSSIAFFFQKIDENARDFGRRVRTLLDDGVPSGFHAIIWNGLDDSGNRVPSGIYFLRIQATGSNAKQFVATRKLILMK